VQQEGTRGTTHPSASVIFDCDLPIVVGHSCEGALLRNQNASVLLCSRSSRVGARFTHA
jgi:hypothetical protein